MSILQGLKNKPYKSYKEMSSSKPVSSIISDKQEKEPKFTTSKDESFNFLANVNLEKFLSPDFQILKVLKNRPWP